MGQILKPPRGADTAYRHIAADKCAVHSLVLAAFDRCVINQAPVQTFAGSVYVFSLTAVGRIEGHLMTCRRGRATPAPPKPTNFNPRPRPRRALHDVMDVPNPPPPPSPLALVPANDKTQKKRGGEAPNYPRPGSLEPLQQYFVATVILRLRTLNAHSGECLTTEVNVVNTGVGYKTQRR